MKNKIFLSSEVMENYRFITTEQSHKKIKRILEAIEYGDSDLYWADGGAWEQMHGYGDFSRLRALGSRPAARLPPTERQARKYKQYRDCFGEYDMYHRFCTDVCTINTPCLLHSERKGDD